MRGTDTGHRIELLGDSFRDVAGKRVQVSDRRYRVTTPSGMQIEETWNVVRTNQITVGSTVMGIGDDSREKFMVYIFKPHPAVMGWQLEFPGGAKENGESIEMSAGREFEAETGFRAGKLHIIMEGMHFAPYRFEQSEYVMEATDLTIGRRKPDFEERPIEVHLIPVALLPDLLKYGVIKDFRTYAVTADYLLRKQCI